MIKNKGNEIDIIKNFGIDKPSKNKNVDEDLLGIILFQFGFIYVLLTT
jgi:hypothetical protein